MNDVLRIARLKIALQRAFLGRAILIFTSTIVASTMVWWHSPFWLFESPPHAACVLRALGLLGKRLPSELPALEMPFGGQFWGGQFLVCHSSELPALFILFFCVDMTFNWFQMLFRVFCIVSVQDLYALEQFQSTRQQQQLRETQVEIELDTRCSTFCKLHNSVYL